MNESNTCVVVSVIKVEDTTGMSDQVLLLPKYFCYLEPRFVLSCV